MIKILKYGQEAAEAVLAQPETAMNIENIVADIIIRMTPDVGAFMNENTVLLASGIISERAEDVVTCFEKHGFEIVERVEDNGWCALAVKKKAI